MTTPLEADPELLELFKRIGADLAVAYGCYVPKVAGATPPHGLTRLRRATETVEKIVIGVAPSDLLRDLRAAQGAANGGGVA